ncbi:hypothetical protein [uncultured Microscilla sp.]|uniref:hypothetical protein n=1 Tax=uncultured Microscilla sp. TaxID=432653 RepID=UPI00262EE3B9|nr:hypothetical protein [uncultured Microscilla sp.]
MIPSRLFYKTELGLRFRRAARRAENALTFSAVYLKIIDLHLGRFEQEVND